MVGMELVTGGRLRRVLGWRFFQHATGVEGGGSGWVDALHVMAMVRLP